MAINYGYGTPNNYVTTSMGAYQPITQNFFAWVQGEAAAQAYQVAPNATVMLMDSERPVLYMKSADATGRPGQMVKQYLVTEEQYMQLQNSQPDKIATKDELDKIMGEIEEIKRKYVLRKEYRNE